MLDVDTTFAAAIKAGNVEVAELYDILLPNNIFYYYTSYNKQLIWGATRIEYNPIPIQRTPVKRQLGSKIDECTLKLANITSEFTDVLHRHMINNGLIYIRKILFNLDYGTGREIPLIQGRINIEWDRKEVIINCRADFGSLGLQVPNWSYTEQCNNKIFDSYCELIEATYEVSSAATSDSSDLLTVYDNKLPVDKVAFDGGDEGNPVEIGDTTTGGTGSGTAVVLSITYVTASTGFIWYWNLNGAQYIDDEILTGGGNTITVNGTPAQDDTYFQLGEIKINAGNNVGQRRLIRTTDDTKFHVANPLPYEVLSGIAFNVYPGCDGQATTCRDKYMNLNTNGGYNYNGFLYVPKPEEIYVA